MTTETALTLPERASAAEAERRAAAEKTNGIRREIDAYLDKMPDDELLEVLQFVQIEVLHEVIEA